MSLHTTRSAFFLIFTILTVVKGDPTTTCYESTTLETSIRGTTIPTKTASSSPSSPSGSVVADVAEFLANYGLKQDLELAATVFSLLYGLPLHYFLESFQGPDHLAKVGVNTFSRPSGLASPSFTAVPYPNTDTQYAFAVTDLSQSDLVINLPVMQENRLYLFDFWDVYGSQYAAIGNVVGSAAGKYLIQANRHSDKYGVFPCEGYQGCISSPTLDGVAVIRVEVKSNGTDLKYVDQYVDSVKFTETNKHKHRSNGKPNFHPLAAKDFRGLSNDLTLQILELTARLEYRNSPWASEQTALIRDVLYYAGIHGGSYQKPSSVNLTLASEIYQKIVEVTALSPLTFKSLNNGWRCINPITEGQFLNSTDYLQRAFWGKEAYLQNTAPESLYPMPSEKTFELTEKEAVLIEFSGKPPVGNQGFWSLTAYNEKSLLIPNPLKVYAVGDRSNVTYPDGDLIYPHYPLTSFNSTSRNDPFQILVQGWKTPPAKNWTHNWLPAPNGEKFSLTLRVYDPAEPLSDGTYQYPIVKKQAAITGS